MPLPPGISRSSAGPGRSGIIAVDLPARSPYPVVMKRFFDYPDNLWDYFQQVDRRFQRHEPPLPQPLEVELPAVNRLGDIRAVLWDVYGTLVGLDVGDLEKSRAEHERLQAAARALIAEFDLTKPLQNLHPDSPPDVVLRDRYLQGITDSHLRSAAMGIEYPEVRIEVIWQSILEDCCRAGWVCPYEEPPRYTAFRWAYFFDAALQQVYLYPHAAETLQACKQAGIIQGIISNAQFYTPLHLRRLLRRALGDDDLKLGSIFTDTLVLFSYELGFSKPNPRSFQRAVETLARQGITREEILYVGNDMLNDVWTALRAGIRAAFCAVDASQADLRPDDERCRGLQPDVVITDLQQFCELIPPPAVPA